MNAVTIPNIGQLEKFKTLQIIVNSPETELQARSYLTDVRLAGKRLDQDIKALKRPHQDCIKDIDEAARPWKDILSARDQDLEKALLAYARQVRAAAEEAQRKLNEKYEKKVERMEQKAVEQGKPMPIVLPPPIVATPPKSVESDGARQTIVKRKAWRIKQQDLKPEMSLRELFGMCNITGMDERWPDAIPSPDYFFLDQSAIGKIVRAGGKLQGIEVYEEESIAVKACV
jgi:hypothetical protein